MAAETVDPWAPVRRMDALWRATADGQRWVPWVDAQTYLPDDLLTKMDRATMAFGVEARSPLLDDDLWVYVAGIPRTMLLDHRVGKKILRRAYEGVLPGPVLTRAKKGFGVPIASWMRSQLRPAVQDLLLSPRPGRRAAAGRGRPANRGWLRRRPQSVCAQGLEPACTRRMVRGAPRGLRCPTPRDPREGSGGVNGVRVGVLGAGRWGRNLVKDLCDLGSLAAVVDLDPCVRAEISVAHPGVVVGADYRALLASSTVDAVVIATPAPTHAYLAVEALRAGKHVFVEKPFTLTVADADALFARPRRPGGPDGGASSSLSTRDRLAARLPRKADVSVGSRRSIRTA